MGRLTTHVLDTHSGQPAAGMRYTLVRVDGGGPGRDETVCAGSLNADGRCDGPLLEGHGCRVGRYRLVFAVASYFRARGTVLPDPPFLDEVPIAFGIADADRHHHVPLLVSPWAYSSYRGS